jgi:nucleoside-diphosphate-sugar epimerase
MSEIPCDAIVHCAAAAGPWHSADDIHRDNELLMDTLVETAIKWKANFIFMSSISVHGDITTPIVNEHTPIAPTEPYGRSKVYGEELLRLNEVPHLTIRLPGVVGPAAHLRNWLPSVARKILLHEPVEVFNAHSPFNNVVHVADLAEFIASTLRRDIYESDTVVLGARNTLSVGEVVAQLGEGLSERALIKHIPAPRPSFIISSLRAMNNWDYNPMSIGLLINRFAQEFKDATAKLA